MKIYFFVFTGSGRAVVSDETFKLDQVDQKIFHQ